MFYPMQARSQRQTPFGVSIVLPTLLRPELTRAVRSVFAQDFAGRIQILVGIDLPEGDVSQLAALAAECPSHVTLDVLDPGYSTSARHGGVHENRVTGSLRSAMTFLVNSRHVAYLDDDNWWAPDHLSSLRQAIDGQDWAWSLRWLVEPGETEPLCIDEWESVGVGAGIFAEKFGGFVDPSSLMIDKLACGEVIPAWSQTPFQDGRGSDRLVFSHLVKHPKFSGTGKPTSYYQITVADVLHAARVRRFRRKGLVMAAERLPGRVSVGDLVARWRQIPAKGDTGRGGEHTALASVLAELRPGDMIVIGDEDGKLAASLVQAAASARLDCPTLVVGSVKPAAQDRIAQQLAAACRELPVALMPRDGDGVGQLAAQSVAADLVQLGPSVVGLAALERIWPLVRLGGFLIGHGKPTGVVERFAVDHRSGLLSLKFPHIGNGWVIEKGVPPS